MNTQLRELILNVVESSDSEGCSDDLTVTSRADVEALADYLLQSDKANKAGWVFCADSSDREVGFASADQYEDADCAVRSFEGEYGDGDFSVYFRDSSGCMNPCDPESVPADFDV